MFEFLRWVLSDFWRFIGFIVIFGMLLKAIVALVAVILNRKVDIS